MHGNIAVNKQQREYLWIFCALVRSYFFFGRIYNYPFVEYTFDMCPQHGDGLKDNAKHLIWESGELAHSNSHGIIFPGNWRKNASNRHTDTDTVCLAGHLKCVSVHPQDKWSREFRRIISDGIELPSCSRAHGIARRTYHLYAVFIWMHTKISMWNCECENV